ncbi:MAG TPA: hypothetical protein VE998_00045 [Terriglobales bacterium]|nr:hypothetical protein [Terriglobales bacterium]
MKFTRAVCVALAVSAAFLCAQAQLVQFTFPAGSPEDQASDAIAKETDAQKKIALLNDFVQKFSSNPLAVAYGGWQLAQAYQQAGDLKAARAAGEKALDAMPNAVDIAVALANIAQQQKDNAAIVNYAARGAAAYDAIARQPRPAEQAEADFAAQVKRQQESARPAYDYLEGAAFNAIMNEQDAAARMGLVRQFTPAFPKTRYAAQVAQYAIISLLQTGDFSGLASYGEKAVKENPDNAAVVVLVARGYSEDQKSPAHLEQAAVYARRAIALAQADSSLTAEQKSQMIGTAKSVVGWSLLRQDKAAAAIPELKEAAPLLKSNAVDYSTALYGLAFAYAKLNRIAEARATLSEAVTVEGPYQQPARELLQKVNAAKPAAPRKQ